MAVSRELRERVRERFDHRCAYCSVHEQDVGSQLEIEHFQPRSKSGTDEFENLVYSCTACNRFKSSYWPADNAPRYLYPLHPLRDDLQTHVDLLHNGRLTGLTKRGQFHIELVHLNRSQLVSLRLKRIEQNLIQQQLQHAQHSQRRSQERIKQLETELVRLQTEIMFLRRSSRK